MFFSRSDYHMTRSAARVVSKESERYGFSKTLQGTYGVEKSVEVQEKLNEWATHGHSRRGLERWANAKHGEERQQDQFQAIMAVLRAQDDMLARKNKIDEEKLRKISHKSTKLSRQFARMMGKADSYAMALELRAERGETDSVNTTTTQLADMTVASDEFTVDTTHTTTASIDTNNNEMKDSSQHSKFRRFGFGRNKKGAENERISRVA
jgi:hypothetical protein